MAHEATTAYRARADGTRVYGTIIPADPHAPEIDITSPKGLGLKSMQKAVDGLIEFVYLGDHGPVSLPHGFDMFVVNESGLLERLPLNARATRICGNTLVGDVILTSEEILREHDREKKRKRKLKNRIATTRQQH